VFETLAAITFTQPLGLQSKWYKVRFSAKVKSGASVKTSINRQEDKKIKKIPKTFQPSKELEKWPVLQTQGLLALLL